VAKHDYTTLFLLSLRSAPFVVIPQLVVIPQRSGGICFYSRTCRHRMPGAHISILRCGHRANGVPGQLAGWGRKHDRTPTSRTKVQKYYASLLL